MRFYEKKNRLVVCQGYLSRSSVIFTNFFPFFGRKKNVRYFNPDISNIYKKKKKNKEFVWKFVSFFSFSYKIKLKTLRTKESCDLWINISIIRSKDLSFYEFNYMIFNLILDNFLINFSTEKKNRFRPKCYVSWISERNRKIVGESCADSCKLLREHSSIGEDRSTLKGSFVA